MSRIFDAEKISWRRRKGKTYYQQKDGRHSNGPRRRAGTKIFYHNAYLMVLPGRWQMHAGRDEAREMTKGDSCWNASQSRKKPRYWRFPFHHFSFPLKSSFLL